MPYILIILLSFLTINLNAQQSLEIPNNLVVTVQHSSGKPHLTWSINNPEAIDGYIIKRDIIDFPNTYGYNTIAVIDDPYTFEYTDNSTVYGEAQPDLRSETYRILSFDSIGNERLLSPMSEARSTILFTGKFDYCLRANLLRWSSYTKTPATQEQYSIYKSNNSVDFSEENKTIFPDTFYSSKISEYNQQYQYYIEAKTDNGHISQSNLISMDTDAPEQAKYLKINKLSNENEGVLNIDFELDEAPAVKTLYVLQYTGNEVDTVYETAPDGRGYYSIDLPHKLGTQAVGFQVLASDSCPQKVIASQLRHELQLQCETESSPKYLNFLSPSAPLDNQYFDVYRKSENEEFTLEAANIKGEFTDDISDIINSQILGKSPQINTEYKYQTDFEACLYISNHAVCKHQAKMILYNAINPKSPYPEDRIFRPLSVNLIDYEMLIFDDVGNVVFSTKNPQKGWDAYLPSGKIAPRASYIYIIKYKDNFGKEYSEKGIVSVVY